MIKHIYAVAICAMKSQDLGEMQASLIEDVEDKTEAHKLALQMAHDTWPIEDGWTLHAAAINGFIIETHYGEA